MPGEPGAAGGRACAACGKECRRSDGKLMTCGGCRRAVYCSPACGAWHWRAGRHRFECSRAGAAPGGALPELPCSNCAAACRPINGKFQACSHCKAPMCSAACQVNIGHRYCEVGGLAGASCGALGVLRQVASMDHACALPGQRMMVARRKRADRARRQSAHWRHLDAHGEREALGRAGPGFRFRRTRDGLVEIVSIAPGGPADEASLATGDVIVSVGGRRCEDLQRASHVRDALLGSAVCASVLACLLACLLAESVTTKAAGLDGVPRALAR